MWSSNTPSITHADSGQVGAALYPFVDRTKAKLDSLVLKIVRRKKRKRENNNNGLRPGSGNDGSGSGSGLTTRGASLALVELNPQQLRSIKAIIQKCGKEAADYFCYKLMDKGFKSDNSLERYVSLLLLKELLSKSHYVRQYIFKDFNVLVKQIVNIPNVCKLPPPEAMSAILHKKALSLVRQWCSNYGTCYRKLNIAAKYLESQLPEFYDTSLRALSRREREEEERQQRTQRILRVQLDNLGRDLRDSVDIDTNENWNALIAIKATLTEAEELLEILVPSVSALAATNQSNPEHRGQSQSERVINNKSRLVDSELESDDDSILWDDDDDNNDDDDDVYKDKNGDKALISNNGSSADGYNVVAHIPSNYELVINIPIGGEGVKHRSIFSKGLSSDSETVVRESLLDCRKEIQKSHLPLIESWIRILSRVEPDTLERKRARSRLLREALQLKSKFRVIIQKCNDVGVVLVSDGSVPEIGINNPMNDYVQLVATISDTSSTLTNTSANLNNSTRKRKTYGSVQMKKQTSSKKPKKSRKNSKKMKKDNEKDKEKRNINEGKDEKDTLSSKEKRPNKGKGKAKRKIADPFKR